MRNPEVWAQWQRLVAEQEASGLTVAEFCRRRRISRSHWFAWRRRLNAAGSARFVAVRVAEDQPVCRATEVRPGGGRSILLEPGLDAVHLRAVLEALA